MAQLPIRLAGRAAPQIGGPQSKASTSFGAGLQQFGQGVSNAAIAGARANTAEENLDVSRAALRIQEASNLNQRSVIETSSDGQQVNEGIQDFQKNIMEQEAAGKSEGYRDKLKDATSGIFSKARISSANAGINMDVNNLMTKIDSSVDAAVRMARENPEDSESTKLLVDDIMKNISGAVGISKSAEEGVLKEVENKIAVSSLQGFMDQGLHGAMFVKDELDGIKFNNILTADQKLSLSAQADSQVRQYQKQALSNADTQIANQLAMEQGGRDTGLTPEKMEQSLQGIGLNDVQIAQRVALVKRNKFYGQEVRVTAQMRSGDFIERKRNIEETIERISDENIDMASDFAVEAFAQLDALNDLETEKRANPYGYAMDWIPSLRNQDKQINEVNARVQAAAPGSPEQDAARTELLGLRQAFASNLKEQGQLVFGNPNAIPIAGKNAVNFFKTQLDANLPDIQAQMVSEMIEAYGPAAAGQVMSTFFNEADQQSWQYIGPILFSNRRGAENAISAHKNWNANKKLLSTDQLKTVKEAATNGMVEFGTTFQGGNVNGTLQAGIQLVQEIMADQMLRGVDEKEAITNAVEIATGHFSIVNTVRMSKANMSKHPSAQTAITNINTSLFGEENNLFNQAIVDALPFEHAPGDENNEEFLNSRITPYTSPQGDGIIMMIGEGINAIPILDANDNQVVLTWSQLNILGESMPALSGIVQLERQKQTKAKRSAAGERFKKILSGMLSGSEAE